MFKRILTKLNPEDTSAVLFKKAVTIVQAAGAELMMLSVLTPEGEDSLVIAVLFWVSLLFAQHKQGCMGNIPNSF